MQDACEFFKFFARYVQSLCTGVEGSHLNFQARSQKLRLDLARVQELQKAFNSSPDSNAERFSLSALLLILTKVLPRSLAQAGWDVRLCCDGLEVSALQKCSIMGSECSRLKFLDAAAAHRNVYLAYATHVCNRSFAEPNEHFYLEDDLDGPKCWHMRILPLLEKLRKRAWKEININVRLMSRGRLPEEIVEMILAQSLRVEGIPLDPRIDAQVWGCECPYKLTEGYKCSRMAAGSEVVSVEGALPVS